MLIEGRVGPLGVQSNGALVQPRLTFDASQAVQDAHGRYTEPVMRGGVFSAGTTAAATIGVLTTTGVTWHLYNPPNSNVAAALLKVSFGATSATFVVGTVYHAVNVQTTTPTGTTALTIRSNLITGANPAKSAVSVFSAATLANTPVQVMPFFSVPATANTNAASVVDELAGLVVIYPGNAYSVQASSAATAIGHLGGVWEEIPLS